MFQIGGLPGGRVIIKNHSIAPVCMGVRRGREAGGTVTYRVRATSKQHGSVAEKLTWL